MTHKCVICGIKWGKRSDPDLSFHRFPKAPHLRTMWIRACKLKDSDVLTNSVICSKHFKIDDFDDRMWPKTRLLPSAVPSPSSSYQHLQQSSSTISSSQFGIKHFEHTFPSTSELPGATDNSVLTLKANDTETDENMVSDCSRRAEAETMLNVPPLPVSSSVSCQVMDMEPSTSADFKGTYETVEDNKQTTDAGPRTGYIGDLKVEHFSSPRKAKRNLDMLTNTIKSQRKKLRVLQVQKRRLESRINNFKDLLQHLADSKIISEEIYSNMMADTPEDVKHIVSRQLKTKNAKYSPEIREFALSLHFYSPKAYLFVRKKFNNLLPHATTIQRWYSILDGEPGFTKEAFDAIKSRSKEKDIFVNIVIDEIHIRQFVQWTGQKYEGYVDFGIQNESTVLATSALVFMATAMNSSWKIPLGYFLIKSLGGVERANLTKTCLKLLFETGVKCHSLTFDGASTNISMCTNLGASYSLNNFKPWFLHPITNEKVFTFWDACHMLKLCRNTLGDKKCIMDGQEREIRWSIIEKLGNTQTIEGLHAGNKLSKRHLNYQNEKMNVRLAAQTLSNSVADAINFCKFFNGDATADFCRNINDSFDILNSMNIFAKYKYKEPLSVKNYELFKSKIEYLIDYLKNLHDNFGTLLTETNRKTGFLGLIVSLTNVLNLYDILICTGKMNYLMTYKLSQDHLETFFSAVRSRGGFNNNPTASQFKAAYKRLLVHHQITASPNANCTILDATSILFVGSRQNSKTCDLAYIENNEEIINLDFVNELVSVSPFVENIVVYIGGYISRTVLKKIDCTECRRYLSMKNKELCGQSFALIKKKNRGKLTVPHPDLVNICLMAEKVFRCYKEDLLSKKKFAEYVKLKVLENSSNTFESEEIKRHLQTQDLLDNHKIQILKLVIDLYFKIRIHYECKLRNEKSFRVREKFTKLILFRNE